MSLNYALKTSSEEIARLRHQSNFWREDAVAMLDAIGIEPDWRCLDLCCGPGGITDLLSARVGDRGHVIGLDNDSDKLAIASEWAKAGGLNVEFIQGDAHKPSLAAQSLDLAHCRFAAGVTRDGARLLGQLINLVRPGGTVAAQECDVDTWICEPEIPAWRRAREALNAVFERGSGADIRLGRKLFRIFQEAGLQAIQVRPCIRASRAGQPAMLHCVDTLLAAREAVIAQGLMSQAELDSTATELREHLSKPETLIISLALVQVWGRLPGG